MCDFEDDFDGEEYMEDSFEDHFNDEIMDDPGGPDDGPQAGDSESDGPDADEFTERDAFFVGSIVGNAYEEGLDKRKRRELLKRKKDKSST